MTAGETSPPGTQRLDKWLWFARVFKSRSLATRAVSDGAVRVTREGSTARIDKPSYALRPGDVLTLTLRGTVRVFEVIAPGARRGPAPEAAGLYRDLSPPRPVSAPSGGPRPSKAERRALDRLKSSNQITGDGYDDD